MSDVSDAGEVVDGLPVVARTQALAVRQPGLVPTRQAAAMAATSFVAGAAVTAVVSRRRLRVGRRARRKNGPLGEILASNSFLVDVHLVKRR